MNLVWRVRVRNRAHQRRFAPTKLTLKSAVVYSFLCSALGSELLLTGPVPVAFAASESAVNNTSATSAISTRQAFSDLAESLLAQNRDYAALEQANLFLQSLGVDLLTLTASKSLTATPTAWLTAAKTFYRTGHLDRCLFCYESYLKAAAPSDQRDQYEALTSVIRGQFKTASAKPNAYAVTVGGASDYFKDAVADGFYRWPQKRFPLRVYIAPGDDIKTYRPEFEEVVRQSVDDWDKATSGKVGLKLVNSEDQADIAISFVDDLHAPALRAEAGKAQLTGDMDGVNKATVLLLTVSPFPDQRMTKDFMRMIAVHEIGHALGLTGHSPYEEDVMFPALSNQRGITTRDVATLIRLYEAGGASGDLIPLDALEKTLATLSDKGKIQLLFAEASKAKAGNDVPLALHYFQRVLAIDPANKNGHVVLANELNNIGLAKASEAALALKYFRWASFFDAKEEMYLKNIDSCLFNLRLDQSVAGRIKMAQQCNASGDFRGAVVEYRAAMKLTNDSTLSTKLAQSEKNAIAQPLE